MHHSDIYEAQDVIDFCLLTNWSISYEFFRLRDENLRKCNVYIRPSKFRKRIINSVRKEGWSELWGVSEKFIELLKEEPAEDKHIYIPCFICQKDFKYSSLVAHLVHSHKLDKGALKEYFTLYNPEYKALGIDTDEKIKKFICKICEKDQMNTQIQRRHLYSHFNLSWMVCPHCKNLMSAQNIIGHLRRIHNISLTAIRKRRTKKEMKMIKTDNQT